MKQSSLESFVPCSTFLLPSCSAAVRKLTPARTKVRSQSDRTHYYFNNFCWRPLLSFTLFYYFLFVSSLILLSFAWTDIFPWTFYGIIITSPSPHVSPLHFYHRFISCFLIFRSFIVKTYFDYLLSIVAPVRQGSQMKRTPAPPPPPPGKPPLPPGPPPPASRHWATASVS